MPRWAGAIARRLWPDANSWNFYAACSWNPVPEPLTEGIARFRFVFGCAFKNLSPIRHCDTVLYDGIAGFGGHRAAGDTQHLHRPQSDLGRQLAGMAATLCERRPAVRPLGDGGGHQTARGVRR